MNALARTWLRRIALGLPLVTIPSGCWFDSTGCGDLEPRTHTYSITEEQRGMVLDLGCEPLCADLDEETGQLRNQSVQSCMVVEVEGAPAIECTYAWICIGGRRPSGLLEARHARAASPVGEWLARSARLETASVPAFLDLATELALHGAPRGLIDGARAAARDEVAHARAISELAARFGAELAPVERAPSPPRSLREVTLDNAIEGCTREAYAALLAAHQARSATDPRIARAYERIARDEARHALWSFALHGWGASRLAPREARAVEEERRAAVADLVRELESESASELRSPLGLPTAERSVALAAALA